MVNTVDLSNLHHIPGKKKDTKSFHNFYALLKIEVLNGSKDLLESFLPCAC